MKKIFVIVLFCVISVTQYSFSQVEDISTDRPDQSESPYLMDKGFFQIEAGVVSEHDEPVKDVKTSSLSAPSVLLRYGIAKNVELRAGIEVNNSKTTISGTSTSESGMGPIMAGTKIKLFTEKGSMPETALLLSVSIPFKENSAFQSDYIGTEFRFAMTNSLGKRFSLSYNIGGEFGSGEPGATGLYTIALGASLVKKLSGFVELYGFMPQKTSPDHRFDAGLTYLILKNVQVDLAFGFGISERSPDYFIGGGVSVRLPK
ncbi:MAG TPA: transporter [Ignavibacteria bacterium]|nr:transporter [Ignavibacteria bacterium]HRF66345.1 transporter [Ignavibacteria bacterium]HRJ04323.1 transporter [Ignavibacteria bacterium]